MKIGEITQKPAIQRAQELSSEKPSAQASDFKALLEGELGMQSESVKSLPENAERTGCMSGTVELLPAWNVGMPCIEASGTVQAANASAQRLDQLGRVIGDGSPNLKRIDQVINALSKESEYLQEQAKSLPENHPLREATNELSVLAYVESVKWKRGDYL